MSRIARIANINDHIEFIVRRVDELEEQRDKLQEQVDGFEVSDHVSLDDYDSHIDECHDIVKVGDATFRPSLVLKECDPIAYDLGYQDYIASLDFSEVSAYTELTDELADIECLLEDFEDERFNLETKLEELEEDD